MIYFILCFLGASLRVNGRVADGSPACASFLPSALFDSTHRDGIRAWHLKRVCSLLPSTARPCKQIWDLKTYKIKNDLPGHTDEVYCVDFVADKLVSGGRDRTVKMCVIRALSPLLFSRHFADEWRPAVDLRLAVF